MLFNSFEFLGVFLPITLIVYYALVERNFFTLSKTWLIIVSLGFYSWWKISYLPILLGSATFNYLAGRSLISGSGKQRKAKLVLGIILNLFLLGFFKYTNFFIENLNYIVNANIKLLEILLPLGISFFTFTQIAFLADAYKKSVSECNFIDYLLFVTFFPHLLAGPILHHKEMMPQFKSFNKRVINYDNLSKGLFIFSIGLFKKVVFADTMSIFANKGFDNAHTLTMMEAWVTSLTYSLQIYFDFSGYSDMAIGIALMFNIIFPINFNSPYKATNIGDFWDRWHITLTRFLKEYVYIPLGGNRLGKTRTLLNLLLTFLVSGFWHGSGWTFIFWGFLHGFATIAQRLWSKAGLRLNSIVGWFLTFNFVNIAWVFFRAKEFKDAISILQSMFGFSGLSGLSIYAEVYKRIYWPIVIIAITLAFLFKNSNSLSINFKPTTVRMCYLVLIAFLSLVFINSVVPKEFLYYDF